MNSNSPENARQIIEECIQKTRDLMANNKHKYAVANANKAFQLADDLYNTTGVTYDYQNLLESSLLLGKTNEVLFRREKVNEYRNDALKYYNKAFRMLDEQVEINLENSRNMVEVLLTITELLNANPQNEDVKTFKCLIANAGSLYRKYKNIDDCKRYTLALIYFGDYYTLLKNHKKAVTYYVKASKLLERCYVIIHDVQVENELATLYRKIIDSYMVADKRKRSVKWSDKLYAIENYGSN